MPSFSYPMTLSCSSFYLFSFPLPFAISVLSSVAFDFAQAVVQIIMDFYATTVSVMFDMIIVVSAMSFFASIDLNGLSVSLIHGFFITLPSFVSEWEAFTSAFEWLFALLDKITIE